MSDSDAAKRSEQTGTIPEGSEIVRERQETVSPEETNSPAQRRLQPDTSSSSGQPVLEPSSDTSPTPDVGGSSSQPIQETTVQVYGPSTSGPASTPSELDEQFFEPTLNDVQAHHKSVLARSQKLNEAPLLTSKYRDAERAEKEKKKADKWPNTTIRIRFTDGTLVQSVFPSSSPIQPVYDFVRTVLDPSVVSKPFILWQPPRTQYPEHPAPPDPKKAKTNNPAYKTSIIPPANYGFVKGSLAQGLQSGTGGKETLAELGLVPQSVLLLRWTGEGAEEMNLSAYPAPLKDELKEKKVPLPPTVPKGEESTTAGSSASGKTSSEPGKTEKKIPKWLQKGLLKKK